MVEFVTRFLDILFGFSLSLPVPVSIGIISFLLSILVILIYKYSTNQTLMRSLKGEIQEHQKSLKQHKDNPDKMMEVQKLAMEANMKYLSHSMRPTLITFLPLLFIFGWLSAHFQYVPISPGVFGVDVSTFSNNSESVNVSLPLGVDFINKSAETQGNLLLNHFMLRAGEVGKYTLNFSTSNRSYTKIVDVTTLQRYEPPEKIVDDGFVKSITTIQKPLVVFDLGFFTLKWIGTYIIFSIIFSMSLRKLLNIA